MQDEWDPNRVPASPGTLRALARTGRSCCWPEGTSLEVTGMVVDYIVQRDGLLSVCAHLTQSQQATVSGRAA